jgi:PPOX class probable F420-dependent enzyme
MTDIPQSHRDLLDQPVAVVGTIDPEGRPHSTMVWFLAEDGDVKLSLNRSRRKVRNLTEDPGISVLIPDLANPMRYVEIRGDADVAPDPDYAFAERLGAKYGADLREYDEPGDERVVVTVKPTRVNAVDMTAG